MASSTGSSSAHAHSPSPSPRSMRFAGARQQQHLSTTTASSSFLPLPPLTAVAGGLHIPHSQADLDRLQMERQLEELSMMSSSRASTSIVTRSSSAGPTTFQPHRPLPPAFNQRPTDDFSLSHDDFGSSVEFARANSPTHNLSANASGRRSNASSFNTTAGGGALAPSPVSTNGHHASAITLRTGLVGSGLPTSHTGGKGGGAKTGGFDDERELGKMLRGAGGAAAAPASRAVGTGEGFAFGLSDLGFPSIVDDEPPTPKAHPQGHRPRKLADALGRTASGLSPRPTTGATHHHHARVASPLRNAREGTEESLFTTLARGVEDQLLLARQPMRDVASPAQPETGVRRSTSGGGAGKKKRPTGMAAADTSISGGRRSNHQAARARAVSGGNSHQQASLYLPDVTGLSEAVGETPLRPSRRPTVQEGREPAQPYPLPELSTLQSRLLALEAENAHSHRRIATLESELELTRERAQAARDEWALERESLGRRASEGEGEWERRYYEVVEQKKDLENLVASLRSQVLKLQTDLTSQQTLIASLQSQRQADQAELVRRGQEVDRLRDEVRQLSEEVGGLRRAFESREQGRREVEAQTSPRLWEQHAHGHSEAPRRPAASAQGLGFAVNGEIDARADLSVIEEEERPRRSERQQEERRSARTSPVERPASRLSDGLRMAAATHASPPLPSSPRMADVLPPPSPRPRSRFSTTAAPSGSASRRPTEKAPHLHPLPPSPPSAWAASFEQEEPVLDLDEETEIIPDGDLVDLRDDNGADETIRPASPVRARVRTTTSGQRGQSSRQRQSPAVAAAADAADRLPPQTVLTRVLRELEDDYAHYKAIYSELADQYKVIDAASNVAKRNVLAEHLREVIDTLEQKGDQIASLYSLLTFADRPLPATSPAALSADEQKAFRSVKDLLRSVQEHDLDRKANSGSTGRRRRD